MRAHFDTSQPKALLVRFDSQHARIGAKLAAAFRRTVKATERDAKIFCPVDTGTLRNSISSDITGDGRFGSMSAEVGPTVDYGIYVNDGTRNQAPQPFVDPALAKNISPFERAVAQIGEDLV